MKALQLSSLGLTARPINRPFDKLVVEGLEDLIDGEMQCTAQQRMWNVCMTSLYICQDLFDNLLSCREVYHSAAMLLQPAGQAPQQGVLTQVVVVEAEATVLLQVGMQVKRYR